MKIITCALAILAAVSTAAVAKDLKQDKAAPTPTVKAQTDRCRHGQGDGRLIGNAWVTVWKERRPRQFDGGLGNARD